jgi:hypothetical protein
MSRLSVFKAFLLSSLVVIGCQKLAFCDIVSLDSAYVAGQALSVTKLNNDRQALTDGVNNIRGVYAGSVQSSGQVKADTLGEENMADDVNPRIRTSEGASCPDFVYSGLLPSTSASLVISIPAGVAYPDGYRVEKTTSTGATLTASRWTYYYLLTSGSFDTNVVTIGAATPTAPANSALLFRASSDATTINTVTDLRKTSCASGPYTAISDVVGEGTLSDLLSYGVSNRRFSPAGRTPEGYVNGLHVSLDSTTTQFKVTKGSAYINGKYRGISTDVTVPLTADAPSDGTSGIDSGSVVSDTTYFVYAVADKTESPLLSITYSTSGTSPGGVTNARLLGKIGTDSNVRFASANTVFTTHAYSDREVPGAWLNMNGIGSIYVKGSSNVSSVTDNAQGDYTMTWDQDFNDANYSVVCNAYETGTAALYVGITSQTAGTTRVFVSNAAGGNTDTNPLNCIALGDMRR